MYTGGLRTVDLLSSALNVTPKRLIQQTIDDISAFFCSGSKADVSTGLAA